MHYVPVSEGQRKVSPLEFQIPLKNWANKPPDEERYTQRFQLTLTISDSNDAVTTINNATYSTRMWEVFFSIEVQVPIDGVKRNEAFNQSYTLANFEVVFLVY